MTKNRAPLNPENALMYGSFWIQACAEYRSGDVEQAIKILEPSMTAIAHPYNLFALALFHGQAGEMNRARDLVLAASTMARAESAERELLDLRDKVVSILDMEESLTTAISPTDLIEVLDRVLTAYPNSLGLYSPRAVQYLCARMWSQATADFKRIVEEHPEGCWNWYHWGLISLQQGDMREYQKACREMVERFANSKDPGDRHAMCHLVFLGTQSGFDIHQLSELYGANRAKTLNDGWERVALYRCGRFEEARNTSQETSFGAVAAMVEHRLGNESRARDLLATAREVYQSKRDPITGFWLNAEAEPWSILEPEVLLREAEALIAPGEDPCVPPLPK